MPDTFAESGNQLLCLGRIICQALLRSHAVLAEALCWEQMCSTLVKPLEHSAFVAVLYYDRHECGTCVVLR